MIACWIGPSRMSIISEGHCGLLFLSDIVVQYITNPLWMWTNRCSNQDPKLKNNLYSWFILSLYLIHVTIYCKFTWMPNRELIYLFTTYLWFKIFCTLIPFHNSFVNQSVCLFYIVNRVYLTSEPEPRFTTY